jgi:hypothetical protein
VSLTSAEGFASHVCQRTTPRRRSRNAWGSTPSSIVVRDDARNIEGIGIRHTSKGRLSASWQQCDVVEGASVSWNSDPPGRPALARLVQFQMFPGPSIGRF